MRIAVAGFQHETNTFGATLAKFADFEQPDSWPGLLRSDEIEQTMAGMNIPLPGFLAAAESSGQDEILPILWCSAEPSSYVTSDAFERISAMILQGISQAGAIDAIYLDLHGAMVTEAHEDGEGELLRRIRAVVGPDLPIAVSLDFHANVSQAMVGPQRS